MTLENKCIITIQPDKTIRIEVVSTGHPLDEVIRMMLKGLQQGQGMNSW